MASKDFWAIAPPHMKNAFEDKLALKYPDMQESKRKRKDKARVNAAKKKKVDDEDAGSEERQTKMRPAKFRLNDVLRSEKQRQKR